MLPARNIEAEDSFLQEVMGAHPSRIEEAVSLALAQKRPHLAARLVGLLEDDQVSMLSSADLKKARQVAQMLIHQNREDRNAWYYEAEQLAVLWAQGRRQKVEKIKRRMRGKNPDPRRNRNR